MPAAATAAPSAAGAISTFSATINLAKLCVGIGILAIPFASVRGGVAFSPCCLAAVAAWNQISVVMLIASKNKVIGRRSFPAGLASTYSKIAYESFGWLGVYLIDLSVVATLLGVCVSYQMGFAQMLDQLPFGTNWLTGSTRYELFVALSAVVVLPLSCSRDLGMLSHASLLGLAALVVGLAFIFVYGFHVHETEKYVSLPLWPQDIVGVASFLGISTFCFGICALVLPIEESMTRRQDAPSASFRALLLVWALYVLVGDGAAVLFAGDAEHGGVQGNILQNLPEKSVSATIVRLLMAIACVVSYPVAVMPVATIVDYLHETYMPALVWKGASGPRVLVELAKTEYEPVSQSSRSGLVSSGDGDVGSGLEDKEDAQFESKNSGNNNVLTHYVVRLLLVVLTSCLSLLSSNFATVIALIGCFSVSILSFAMPPAIHLRLVTLPSFRRYRTALTAASAHSHAATPAQVTLESHRGPISVSVVEIRRRVMFRAAMCLFDLLLCIAGCLLTVVATAVTIASS